MTKTKMLHQRVTQEQHNTIRQYFKLARVNMSEHIIAMVLEEISKKPIGNQQLIEKAQEESRMGKLRKQKQAFKALAADMYFIKNMTNRLFDLADTSARLSRDKPDMGPLRAICGEALKWYNLMPLQSRKLLMPQMKMLMLWNHEKTAYQYMKEIRFQRAFDKEGKRDD